MEERRTERVASAVTPQEREALEAVSKARGITVSELMRDMAIKDAVAEYDRLKTILTRGVA